MLIFKISKNKIKLTLDHDQGTVTVTLFTKCHGTVRKIHVHKFIQKLNVNFEKKFHKKIMQNTDLIENIKKFLAYLKSDIVRNCPIHPVLYPIELKIRIITILRKKLIKSTLDFFRSSILTDNAS